MERVMIIGCGGAGKSTLARQLSEKTGLPVVYLDKLFWRPGWTHISKEEFAELHHREIAREHWILDGNFGHMPERIARCDTIIYLDFSRAACLMGVAKRILTTYGSVRVDMGPGCPERVDLDFLKWVWNFNKTKRERFYTYLSQAEHAKTIVLKNRKEVKAFLEQV